MRTLLDLQTPAGPPVADAALPLGPTPGFSAENLLELERFAEIGRFSASWLHEISHPLTAALLWLEQCGNQQSPPLRRVRHSIYLLQRYVEAARQQVRHESSSQLFYIQSELEQVRQLMNPLARRHGVKLRFAAARGLRLYGDPVKFQQIIANLIRNAVDAYDRSGEDQPPTRAKIVQLSLRHDKRQLIIEVADRGCGISREQVTRLFEPFYTTGRPDGYGLGLGLCTVKHHVETGFRGSISVASSPKHGTRFTATFPLLPES
ncbi:MAG TPA: HAMP domain-containing sensor histidine kinase [Verrucomicrobiae bacterium]|nr:HAMP domain-containing sensor histidine kinase [Verrucomicrobiae bacterium]